MAKQSNEKMLGGGGKPKAGNTKVSGAQFTRTSGSPVGQITHRPMGKGSQKKGKSGC